jgi:hypothetical protein
MGERRKKERPEVGFTGDQVEAELVAELLSQSGVGSHAIVNEDVIALGPC